jgi:hypothetical protein
MNDDVRKYIYGALLVFLVGVSAWVGFLFLNACGFSLTCRRGTPTVDRTPIPSLIPATMPAMQAGSGDVMVSDQCRVAAVDLLGAWVAAGSPEQEGFQFTDVTGQNCQATFEQVKPLFVEANLWSSGLACVSCHSVDVTVSPAQLDLSSYAGIIAGSRRENAESKKGTDILGGGNWKSSLLYEFITTAKADVPGHTKAVSDLLVFAGTPLPKPEATATSIPAATPTP